MSKLSKALAAIMLMTAILFAAGCKPKENNDLNVTTDEPQNITQTSATISGVVEVVAEGVTITEKGVCWSTSENPTVSDNYMTSDRQVVMVICTITGLEPGTTYYVRVYASDGSLFYYGTVQSFTTEVAGSGGGGGNGTFDGHDYVDLGLPSGTLWATCNVGATKPEGYGDFFAWGETQAKTYCGWDNYLYSNGDGSQLTKYCSNSDFGYNGFTDTLTILQPSDDAATVNWGDGWCMPTAEQWGELCEYTTGEYTTQNSVYGRLFKAKNGNKIFLPTAGYYWNNDHYGVGAWYWSHLGCYWLNSLCIDYPQNAKYLHFDSGSIGSGCEFRHKGLSVRPVRSAH